MELNIPAIEGIGGLQIYLVDRYGAKGSIYDVDFEWLGERDPKPTGVGLHYIDHLTHNVYRGRLNEWAAFYERLFNFKQIRYFDIEGKMTGLHSRAMTSPDGKIRIPINEDAGETGQIQEYLQEYKGEGIQHVAMGARDLYVTIETLQANGLGFMPAPNRFYYERIDKRLPKHGEPLERLERDGILIDGEGVVEGGYTKVLLQRFSQTVIGPIFFEFIQRKGDDGFGEGNFKALFESIEEDQIRRGVLKGEAAE
jgi:4-hydroxyphenylpyruvate dioxygenase